jgi:hypothetical protein
MALLGWLFLFVTSGWKQMIYSVLALVTGMVAFLVWSKLRKSWPFAGLTAVANANEEVLK